MEFTYLNDHIPVREAFVRRFTLPYGTFCMSHSQWLASLPRDFRKKYTQSYFERLPYSDRLIADFRRVSFEEALDQLTQMGEVIFLTNEPGGLIHDTAHFGTERLWAARTTGPELAEAVRIEWFRTYELWDRDMYEPVPLLPFELYAFTPNFDQAVIFTHETDESELPETRICLTFHP